ncbi:MAG: peptide chain release factor 1 [Desulfurivibrionaceae bacterium]|nr:peptide chain release factor 1 [Desulfobulbales bacterium]MDT8334383.1 peptide chain release factor 1 [Desulfurivibrionaceae bacterium]
MFSRFENLGEKLLELEQKLADPAKLTNQGDFRLLAKEHAQVSRLHELYGSYKRLQDELKENRALLKAEEDEEMQELVKAEISELNARLAALEQDLRIMLLPRDPKDDKNILLEIRAGTGGDEAALFVGDLYKMYCRYAEAQSWKVEVISSNPIGIGGFKEIIALIKGDQVYSRLKYESGAHRVQRVPATEAQGRIHTSAVTVAVIPEAEDVELNIAPNELRFDVFRSSGPGGQSVNTTDSGVRATHLPTGIIATCQDEKSQHKNKAAALKVLRARLLDAMEREQHDKMSADRKSQIGSGDRSERIRTYNFPQGRMTDHRINLTLYKLDDIMLGKLDDVIMPLIAHYQAEAFKTLQ